MWQDALVGKITSVCRPMVIKSEEDLQQTMRAANLPSAMNTILQKQAHTENILEQILNHLRNIPGSSNAVDMLLEREESNLANLPLTSEEDLNLIEVVLMNEQSRKCFEIKMSQLRGGGMDKFIYRVMSAVFKNSFGMKCSWTGQKNNIPLCNTKLMEVLEGIIRKHHPNMTKREFFIFVSNWLRQAASRYKRKKERNGEQN